MKIKHRIWKSNLISAETDMIAIVPYAILGGIFFIVGFIGVYVRSSSVYAAVMSQLSTNNATATFHLFMYAFLWLNVMNLGVAVILWGFFDITNTDLTLGSDTVNGSIGLLRTKAVSIPIRQIDSIYADKSLFGKLLNYEMVVITADSKIYTFDYIKSAGSLVDEIRKKITEEEKT